MSDLVRIRRDALEQLFGNVDHFVAVCNWARDVLLINGVPSEKISLSRQGINSADEAVEPPRPISLDSSKLKIVFLGRLDPTKGLSVLIDAIKALPELNITLDVFGVAQTKENEEYRRELIDAAANDERIRFRDPIEPNKVIPTLCQYDFLAVPSQWLETGPMVVLEAFAAGTPVVSARFGGMSEIIRDGVDGVLIERNDAVGWSEALHRLARSPEITAAIRRGVRPPRTIREVADDMVDIYNGVLSDRPSR
jgi:glycosyltransferase involved in cell wall biosynthesis